MFLWSLTTQAFTKDPCGDCWEKALSSLIVIDFLFRIATITLLIIEFATQIVLFFLSSTFFFGGGGSSCYVAQAVILQFMIFSSQCLEWWSRSSLLSTSSKTLVLLFFFSFCFEFKLYRLSIIHDCILKFQNVCFLIAGNFSNFLGGWWWQCFIFKIGFSM